MSEDSKNSDEEFYQSFEQGILNEIRRLETKRKSSAINECDQDSYLLKDETVENKNHLSIQPVSYGHEEK